MATFHLHARLLEGGLLAPTRNELQSHEDDDHDAIVALAEQLAARGFAVQIYRHDLARGRLSNGEGAYSVIAEWSGRGGRVR